MGRAAAVTLGEVSAITHQMPASASTVEGSVTTPLLSTVSRATGMSRQAGRITSAPT
jgi:hypothetical protein